MQINYPKTVQKFAYTKYFLYLCTRNKTKIETEVRAERTCLKPFLDFIKNKNA